MADPPRQAAPGDSFLVGNFPNPQMHASSLQACTDDKHFVDMLAFQGDAAETSLDDLLLADFSRAHHKGTAFLQHPLHPSEQMAQVAPAVADLASSTRDGMDPSVGAPAKTPLTDPSTPTASSTSANTKPTTKSTKKRATWGARTPDGRRRRKEPKRADYATTEEYLADWSRWRKIRDSNNRSVKRSREKARERSALVEAENSRLQKIIDGLRASLKDTRRLAHKALTKPSELNCSELERIKSFADA